MEKEKFFSGLWIIIGLIFGSVFTNFVYQDYLAYGGTVRSLVLNNTDLYKASISLFFYILFKRGKQYAFIYLGAYLLQPWIFLYSFAFCISPSFKTLRIIFLWIHVIFADRANGHQRTGSCIYEFISTFYLLCDHLAVADQAKLLCPKKRRNAL